MRRVRGWMTYVVVGCVALATMVVIGTRPAPAPPRASAEVLARYIAAARPVDTVAELLPAEYASLPAEDAVRRLADDRSLSVARSRARPDIDSDDPLEAGLAGLVDTGDTELIAGVYSRLPPRITGWWAVLFPDQIGNLAGAPYPERIAANRVRTMAALVESTRWASPPRPWTRPRPERPELRSILDDDKQLVYFDPRGNQGQGSWAELRGDLDTASHVGVLVPGGSAFITSENFIRYSDRAEALTDAAEGDLAMIVWAAAPFPSGWIEESSPIWARDAASRLADFLADLRSRLPATVSLTLLGHSYGGAVVGEAEKGPLRADRVVHIASAGAGFGVHSADQYSRPCRPRYAMMAPWDPIDYVQDIPGVTGLGHGSAPTRMPGVRRMATGSLPDDPQARDDRGRTLGEQGIAGKPIEGVHSHSEVFIPDSDAWRNILRVTTMRQPELTSQQPPPVPECDEDAKGERTG